MGYCAKVITFSQVACIAIFVVNRISVLHCASMIPGKSWPSMKTYDIWGSTTDKDEEPLHRQRDTITSSNDALLHDYREKTSLRNGRVLNFFTVPSEDECKTEDGRRAGICMNVYECHQKGGNARGQCALGFGSCCVFTATCDQEVKHNITYIVSPSFPALMSSDIKSCKLKIKMMSPDISQLRFDFVHFSMGQPNRRNGNCDGDLFSLVGGAIGDFKICGNNNGQHVYYDVPNGKARDGEPTDAIDVIMNFTSSIAAARFWEIRVSQIPFSQRAPAGCLQYFFGNEGIIQTFNFAENGRHLSNQKYKACIRQDIGMCSIAYESCSEHSFRIGPTQINPYQNGLNAMSPYSNYNSALLNPNGLYYPNGASNNPIFGPNGMLIPNPYGAGGIISPNGMIYGANGVPGIVGPNGMFNALNPNAIQAAQMTGVPLATFNPGASAGAPSLMNQLADQPIQGQDQMLLNSLNGTNASNFTSTSNSTNTTTATTTTTTTTTSTTTPQPLNDDVEGSGNDEDNESDASDTVESLFSLGSFITRAALFRSLKSESKRSGKQFFSSCNDRITLPCIVEDFISVGTGSVPTCSPIHCGNSLCLPGTSPCRVESTVTPFSIGIHFGDGSNKGSPEDNIGACIRYKQMNCI